MDVPIVSFVPLFMFAILFGLSMDYNVFLQSRIREEYLKGATPEQSVTRALARVGRIILAAGAIMTSVFLGFVGDPDVVVKTIGLGLASAILIDVLIVRMIVAPAVMTLLGDRAWALPAWLDRALPKISLEGEPTPAPAGLARGFGAPQPGDAPGGERDQQQHRDAVDQQQVDALAGDQVAPALDQRRERVDLRDRVNPAARAGSAARRPAPGTG